MLPASYVDLIRYDSAAVQRDRRDVTVACAIQSRDIAIVADIWRYKFLTATQLLELHWPGCAPRVGRRRLTKLFNAGLIERFRPVTRTGGSFPWTYHLGQDGHRLLRAAGAIDRRARFELRTIYDYRYVLHEIHLNSWILAWRRLLGPALLAWHGETELEPPVDARRGQLRLDDDRTVRGLRQPTPRLVRPDAVLEVERRDGGTRNFLIEYDRTRRLDKNFGKFLRYDTFLCWGWRHTELAHHGEPPFVVFVCQDEQQLGTFLQTADRELSGHLWHPSDPVDEQVYDGRDHMLFATEVEMHSAIAQAWRVAKFPPHHRYRAVEATHRGVALPARRQGKSPFRSAA
jgi:hypothetical protein